MAVSPEQIGLCGCWQIIAVKRSSQKHSQPRESASVEIGYYATSLTFQSHDEPALLRLIRGHWSAIENGTHYRRDVTFAEDDCRTANRKGAAILASFRNLAIGLYELQQERKKTTAESLRSWCQQQTFQTVWPLLSR